MNNNFMRLSSMNNSLIEANERAQEKIQILSWIVGEWSDLLERPLSKVKDINGALLVGVELAELVKRYPGPYAAEAFLNKMLSKCEQSVSEISLTELIDKQEINIKEKIVEKFGDDCENKNLLVLSAIKVSLSVDNAKEWLPVYKKAWKINPDDIKMPLLKWAMLIYQECMISDY